MGNACGGDVDPEQTRKSKEIDGYLKDKGKDMKREVKLLLLGPGESGKSTIFKQMKLLQINGGFTQEELHAYRYIVYGNCLTQMKILVNSAQKLGIELEDEGTKARAQTLLKLAPGGEGWSRQVGEDVKALWADKGIKATYEKRDTHFQLNDSAAYFFDNVDRFLAQDYLPNDQDVLRARVRSTGIEEAEFTFDDMAFRMLDVGGQRSERRKWIHCFDCVTAVIFCVALSEYDQTLREDESQNRMKESLLLFDEICNSLWFKQTAFILFLNKTDLFREKIAKKDLTCCFPDYTGGCNYDNGVAFIQSKFMAENTSPHQIYVHQTCATNTDNVSAVFKVVRETLLKKILNELF